MLGLGLIPDWGAKIPQTSWPKTQNIKRKKKKKQNRSNIVTSLIKTKKKKGTGD